MRSLALIVLAMVVRPADVDRLQQTQPQLRIARIEALLYNNGTGQFSEDVLSRPDYPLFNVIIADPPLGPSTNTLIRVQIEGVRNRDLYGPTGGLAHWKIRARITAGRAVLGGGLGDIPFLVAGHYSVPFLITHGCDSVHVAVVLLRPNDTVAQTERRTVPFYCGE